MTGDIKLQVQMPAQGWKQFLTGREEMLDGFDRARTKAGAHEVETYHGRVAEAEFRKWLEEFLPKKYAVTSGYVVSQGISAGHRLPHFDVIVYDRLESPVLWVENDPDVSKSGRSLAIPAEHVRMVIEVKSSFTGRAAKAAIRHLNDLSLLGAGVDAPDERYKLYLPSGFACGVVFFDFRGEAHEGCSALNEMVTTSAPRGYFGGVILRAGKFSHTARIDLTQGDRTFPASESRESLWKQGLAQPVQKPDGSYVGAYILCHEWAFSQFAFDIVAMLGGTYERGRFSSFHGLSGGEDVSSPHP